MTKNLTPKRVAIIGGGVSGLSTAYYVWRESPKTDVTLFEASAQLGGLIHTEEADDFIIENGPDCFISEKPAGVELSLDLGLRDELIGTRKQFPQSFILSKGKLEPIPHDFYLMAPRNYPALFKSPLLSWKGKLRAACEPFIQTSVIGSDESLASFVRRRLGQEVLEKLAQPLIGGIYGADPEKLSLRSTFPTFLEMEKNSCSRT
jgi:oxygen-dependent protoporphyrinogen oxidase